MQKIAMLLINNIFVFAVYKLVIVLRYVAAQAFWWGLVAGSVGWPARL
jgi:hypothetical protein